MGYGDTLKGEEARGEMAMYIRDESLRAALSIPPERLGEGTTVRVTIVESEIDLYNLFAQHMLQIIEENNAAGRMTKFIVPVGPVGQYRRLARLCNLRRTSCRGLVLFNMDDYLTDRDEPLPLDSPLSFRAAMEREFHSRLDPELRVPESQRFFPDPRDPLAIGRKIEELGGLDAAFGGIGITGHIAFNEPPAGEVAAEEFARWPTRCLDLNWETSVINAAGACRGAIDYIPRRAVTIGMKEILGARRLRFYCFQKWQSAIVRKALHGPVTAQCPASFLQRHPDAELIVSEETAQLPVS